MSNFYNYDTRGASASSQIIWLENRVKQLEEQLEQSILTERELCARLVQDLVDMRVPASEYPAAIRKRENSI